MATAKRSGNKQPAQDPALKRAAASEVKQAEADAKTGNVETAPEPSHVRDNRDESGVIGPR